MKISFIGLQAFISAFLAYHASTTPVAPAISLSTTTTPSQLIVQIESIITPQWGEVPNNWNCTGRGCSFYTEDVNPNLSNQGVNKVNSLLISLHNALPRSISWSPLLHQASSWQIEEEYSNLLTTLQDNNI